MSVGFLHNVNDILSFNFEMQLNILQYTQYINICRSLCNIDIKYDDYERQDHTTIAAVRNAIETKDISLLPNRIQLSCFKGHEPIISYGCIVRYHNGKEYEYCMVERPHTIEYIDFVRGNYRFSYLPMVVIHLTEEERKRILSKTFDELWTECFQKDNIGNLYDHAKAKYDFIRPNLEKIFEQISSLDPLGKKNLIFPKGRQNMKEIDAFGRNKTFCIENPFACALREFEEESNGSQVTEKEYTNLPPLYEKHVGSNSKNYLTIYFIFDIPQKFVNDSIIWVSSSNITKCTSIKQSCISHCNNPPSEIYKLEDAYLQDCTYNTDEYIF